MPDQHVLHDRATEPGVGNAEDPVAVPGDPPFECHPSAGGRVMDRAGHEVANRAAQFIAATGMVGIETKQSVVTIHPEVRCLAADMDDLAAKPVTLMANGRSATAPLR